MKINRQSSGVESLKHIFETFFGNYTFFSLQEYTKSFTENEGLIGFDLLPKKGGLFEAAFAIFINYESATNFMDQWNNNDSIAALPLKINFMSKKMSSKYESGRTSMTTAEYTTEHSPTPTVEEDDSYTQVRVIPIYNFQNFLEKKKDVLVKQVEDSEKKILEAKKSLDVRTLVISGKGHRNFDKSSFEEYNSFKKIYRKDEFTYVEFSNHDQVHLFLNNISVAQP